MIAYHAKSKNKNMSQLYAIYESILSTTLFTVYNGLPLWLSASTIVRLA